MRITKSKSKLLYHKKLRKKEWEMRNLKEKARESNNFISIPKTLAGYKVHLVPIESLKNKDDGLTEAIEASSAYLIFSEKPFRLCNLKNRINFGSAHWFNNQKKMEEIYFSKKLYKKGNLTLLDISEHTFKKLSPNAQKYFVQVFDKFNHRGFPIFMYRPKIPQSYLREKEEKLFYTKLLIPDSKSLSEAQKIDNWLNFKRKCELWHYIGCRTSNFYKWEKEVSGKKKRLQDKLKFRNFVKGLVDL